MKPLLSFAACLLLTTHLCAAELAMVRLGGSPVEVGRIWGENNKHTIQNDVNVHYLKKSADAGITEDVLFERSRAFVQIAEQIAPHWLEEAKAVARAAGVREDLYIAFVGGKSRNLFLHECTSYAGSREYTQGDAILFHKTRDNEDREQVAYILESSLDGIHKFIAVTSASVIGCSMMVNDQGLAGSADYPAHLTRKGDPSALLPESADPQYRGMMAGSMLRYIAERASTCRQALEIIEDVVNKGYYAGGDVNGNHWLLVDREGTILEVSNNARHVASKFHTQKVYFSRFDNSPAAHRLCEANAPIGFSLFHGVARDPSICLKSSISGMTVEIDPAHPELLTCAWISLPVRSGSFPVLMGQPKPPTCLLNGEAYRLGKQSNGNPQSWEAIEQSILASKEQVLARIASEGAACGADTLEKWSQEQAGVLMKQQAD